MVGNKVPQMQNNKAASQAWQKTNQQDIKTEQITSNHRFFIEFSFEHWLVQV